MIKKYFIEDRSEDGKCYVYQYFSKPNGDNINKSQETIFDAPKKFIKTECFKKKDKSTVLNKFKIRYNPSNCNIIQCVDLANIKNKNITKQSERFVFFFF